MIEEYISIETVNKYQTTFNSTPQGREVFADILDQLGFGKALIETEEDRIRLNECHAFLAKCGIWHPDNAQAISEALLKLPARHQEPPKLENEKEFIE
jgi:hypothetical protein